MVWICMREKTVSTANATSVAAADCVNRLSVSADRHFQIRKNLRYSFVLLMSTGKMAVNTTTVIAEKAAAQIDM